MSSKSSKPIAFGLSVKFSAKPILDRSIRKREAICAKLLTSRTAPSPQHAERADEALRLPGTFRRMRQGMVNSAYAPWVRALLDVEERATVLRWWEPLVIPGLLQTEGYDRAMIRAGRPGDSDAEVEQMVAARMARQVIWDRKDPSPPMLFAVIGEALLQQRVGDSAVMCEQLAHLLEAADNPRITIQVMPFAATRRAQVTGSAGGGACPGRTGQRS